MAARGVCSERGSTHTNKTPLAERKPEDIDGSPTETIDVFANTGNGRVTRIEPLTAWEKSAHMKVQGTEVGLVGGQPNLATHLHVCNNTNALIILLVVLCLIFSEVTMITNVNDKSNHSNQNNTNIQDQRIHRPLGNPPIRRGTDNKGTGHNRNNNGW